MKNIILASGSPRRKEIMEQVGLTFSVIPCKKDEIVTTIVPKEMVEELSRQKALEVYSQLDISMGDVVVIGADTLVAYENQVMGKPKNKEDAIRMIQLLQGNVHQVFTGVTLCVRNNTEETIVTFSEYTDVEIYPMSMNEILDYVETKEPMDKAGAYAIQGIFAQYVKKINGDYNTVVGFPISRILQELKHI